MTKSIALALLHQGLVRNHNEDNLFLLDSAVPVSKTGNYERSAASADLLQFYAVADGMGGRGIGDLAAFTVMRVLDQQRRHVKPGSRFDFSAFAHDQVEMANRSVREQLAKYTGMPVGTTFSLLAIDRDTAYTLSLGNSRIYLFRDNQLNQLTEDHVNQLQERRKVVQYIGFLPDQSRSEAENLSRITLERGDVFILATDGITDVLSASQIAAALNSPSAFVQQIRQIRDLVLQAGGRDNLALIGIKIQEVHVTAKPVRAKRSEHPAVGFLTSREQAGQDREGTTAKIGQAGTRYKGPKIKGSAGYLQSSNRRRKLRPLLFFLFFILLGILLGKVVFSLPALLKIIFP